MDRTRALAPLVALALVLAGCGAPTGGATPTPSPTPSPVPTGTADGGAAVGIPEGLTADGVSEPLAFTNGHVASLADGTFTVRVTYVWRAPNGTELGRATLVGQVDPAAGQFRSREVRSGVGRTARYRFGGGSRSDARVVEMYSDGTTKFFAAGEGADASYGTREMGQGPIRPGWFARKTQLYRGFSAVDTRLVDVETGGNGTVYRIESTDGPHRLGAWNRSAPGLLGSANVTDVRLTARVGGDGLVREYRLARTLTADGEAVRLVTTVEFDDVGTAAVERPGWVDAANGSAGGRLGAPGE